MADNAVNVQKKTSHINLELGGILQIDRNFFKNHGKD